MVKYYAVAVGREPGIYMDWPTTQSMIANFPGAVYKGFATQEEAENWIQMKTNVATTALPAAPKYYAVAVGKVPGVYMDWPTARSMIAGYPGAVYKGFPTHEEAENFIELKTNNPATPKYYAVAVGKVPGVYMDWPSARATVRDYPGAKYKSFPTQEEAENWIQMTVNKIASRSPKFTAPISTAPISTTSINTQMPIYQSQGLPVFNTQTQALPAFNTQTQALPVFNTQSLTSALPPINSMSKKYYAVVIGVTPGIYTDWPTTQAMIKNYPGAVFKSFPTRMEAESFIKNSTISQTSTNYNPLEQALPDRAVIYTDGSFKDNRCGFGVVILSKDGEIIRVYGKVPMAPTNNVAELYAIYAAVSLITDTNLLIYSDSRYCITALTTYVHDWIKNGFLGVPNKELISGIHELIKNRSVNFEYVPAHSGIKYNEESDALAERGRAQEESLVIIR